MVAPVELVAGKYRLTRLLGRGGMGSVWEGVHTTLGTRVAVKFIDSEHANSPEARQRFENEARAAATLRSKHVVEVYDHGMTPDGRPFIVMEFLDGEPLDRRLDRMGRLPARDTAHIVLMVCRALSKAHASGIVHRDLKPENVFLVWDDEDGADVAKVVDFGIAKFTDSSVGSSSATRTGSVLGTPYYMSPEQARGLRSVDYRSDLWSVGVIAFRCITGRLPFEGEAVGDLLVKLCTAPIPVPSQIVPDAPPTFDAWISRALSREPERRFQSAQELGGALATVCGLSMRGSYVTGDLPAVRAGQTGPFAAASGTGPYPVQTPTMASSQNTGAPFTQTPPLPAPPRPKTAAVVVSALVLLVVMAIGAGVVAKVYAGSGGAASAEAIEPAPVVATAPAVQPAGEPEVKAPEPIAVAPVVPSAAPAPVASVAPAPVAAQPPTKGRPRPAQQTKPKAGSTPSKKPAEFDIGY
jgi:tRNA A-37 threonylcarbamoyl transferase component Bud32